MIIDELTQTDLESVFGKPARLSAFVGSAARYIKGRIIGRLHRLVKADREVKHG